jgi:hypothetical protein
VQVCMVALEDEFEPAQGKLAQLVMTAEGSTPSRMNREGAARTYSLYQCAALCPVFCLNPVGQSRTVAQRLFCVVQRVLAQSPTVGSGPDSAGVKRPATPARALSDSLRNDARASRVVSPAHRSLFINTACVVWQQSRFCHVAKFVCGHEGAKVGVSMGSQTCASRQTVRCPESN